VIPRLIRSLARWSTTCVLVIDDLHVLRASGSLEALAGLVDHLPAGFQLALASRGDPGLPIGRLRAERKIVELRAPALAMTRSEGAALLRAEGLMLESEGVATIMTRTEGWPAGLYLAALSVREQSNMRRAVDEFAGDDRLVAQYLREELLSHVAPDRLDFLIRTSILEHLSGALCDAVLDREGSAGTLEALAGSGLMVVPLDRSGDSYRYHSLFAEMLRAELRHVEPGCERQLHRRASDWYSARGDADRAIEHAIDARDVRRAGELLWRNVPHYVMRGRNGSVQDWLEHFTEDEIGSVSSLALAAASTHLADGDGNRLRHWGAVAARAFAQLPAAARTAELRAGVAVIRASAGSENIHAMHDKAAYAYSLTADDSPWRAVCCLQQGVACQLLGDPERARALLEEGAHRGAVGAPSVQADCLSQLALMALDEDDWAAAEAAMSVAMAAVEHHGVGEYPTSALAFAMSALLRAHRGRIDKANRDLRRSRRLLAMLTDFSPWYDAEVRVALARAALRLGDLSASRTLLAEAARSARRTPDAAVLHDWLDEARAQADAASDSSMGRGWSLTTAELRVLQYLPSHLSFPQVAERLYVSQNTVKTHARAVYRKLDASSRSEAVARARDAGLLDADDGA
jgi:LuxR family maltose regulon positive regulatory protein